MISNHVTSRALSKRLYEKGVKIDSEFSWCNGGKGWILENKSDIHEYKIHNCEVYPALLSSEIGELLPPFCTTYSTLDLSNSPKEFVCKQLNGVDIKHKNEAEARGLLLEYLIDNRLIEL